MIHVDPFHSFTINLLLLSLTNQSIILSVDALCWLC
jgi:hypothetical protein